MIILIADDDRLVRFTMKSMLMEILSWGEHLYLEAGNGEEQELTYYRDTVTPEAGYVKVIPKTGFFNTSNKLPIVYWSGFSDDNLSEIQIKINDGEYKTLGLDSSGEGQLQGVDFSKDGKYTLTVRAVDKGGECFKRGKL